MISFYQTPLGISFHSPRICAGERVCAIHKPSKKNTMREWPFIIRLDKRGLTERTCAHGVGHPDRDSLKWLRRFESKKNVNLLGIHGCDGCCSVVQ